MYVLFAGLQYIYIFIWKGLASAVLKTHSVAFGVDVLLVLIYVGWGLIFLIIGLACAPTEIRSQNGKILCLILVETVFVITFGIETSLLDAHWVF